ncbi:hypothetical protein H696_01394 [Fonticula alba]|uniref:dolichyl-phosphate-mannose--protein mannosyltransferase n=1 Tax=Fonticula alba TaxID=691883 RepID=A0A058ZEV2_FONAL|nr:hypothetical protein H696_01394 [Fonticula alba]KCV71987.1 hypothetical protein H696_01394 [Fonticula alba]|eukprot:XP_009493565.1 hypothetical protein H696_01394 [Fonticula alba]
MGALEGGLVGLGRRWPRLADALLLAAVLLLAAGVRLWRLGASGVVTWDEAHFGKFALYYALGRFHFDVHPPLGKMLLYAWATRVCGWAPVALDRHPGEAWSRVAAFEFASNAPYQGSGVPIECFRSASVLAGALGATSVAATARLSGLAHGPSALAGLLVALDLANVQLSRLVVLDPLLFLFTGLSLLATVWYANGRMARPRPGPWARALILALVNGLALSVKWVGLGAYGLSGLVGLGVGLARLRGALACGAGRTGRRRAGPRPLARRLARELGLLALQAAGPWAVYCASFAWHFRVLGTSGPGDSIMPADFQAALAGNYLATHSTRWDAPVRGHPGPPGASPAARSMVTLRHAASGGLLHSHRDRWPDLPGPHQQVTGYQFHDVNNHWLVAALPGPGARPPAGASLGPGSVVRLEHRATGARLTALAAATAGPGLQPGHLRVSALPGPGAGLAAEAGFGADLWEVIALPGPRGSAPLDIRPLDTRFALRNRRHRCLLGASTLSLPKWAFEQKYVFCAAPGTAAESAEAWSVEMHRFEDDPPPGGPLPGQPLAARPPGFWRSFVHLNRAMARANADMTDPQTAGTSAAGPDAQPGLRRALEQVHPDMLDGPRMVHARRDRTRITSRPAEWPLGLHAIRITHWAGPDAEDDGPEDDHDHPHQEDPQHLPPEHAGLLPTDPADETGDSDIAATRPLAGPAGPAPDAPAPGPAAKQAHVRLMLGGSLACWAGGTMAVALLAGALLAGALADARLGRAPPGGAYARLYRPAVAVIGWLAHYLPFWAVGRVMYVHHFLPATAFGALAAGHVAQLLQGTGPPVGHLAILAAGEFLLRRATVYGMTGHPDGYLALRWTDGWPF